MRSLTKWLGPVALAVLASGCSKPTTGTLTGMVTIDGQPAKSGSITILPIDGHGQSAGGVIADGKYSATASPGKMKVQIRVPKVVGHDKAYDTPNSPMTDIVAESLPKRYNDQTELTVEVTPGEMVKDFELKSK